jgi:hypothetical protein
MDGSAITLDEPGIGQVEIFPIDPTEQTLLALLTEIFEDHWRDVVFGLLVQGAVFELQASERPKLSMLDGYLTMVFGTSHFHLCIGDHRGSRANPTDPELARLRRTARAEFFRMLSPEDDAPTSWGLRLFNGGDDQQLTVFLPNPFLSAEMKILKQPRWQRLELWDRLRQKYLGLDADPRDRAAARFWHA